MCIQKKKIIKLLMGVALVGLTLAVLCSSVFADDFVIPEGSTSIQLTFVDRFYQIYGLTDWVRGSSATDVPTNTRIYWNLAYRTNDYSPICKLNFTYYMTMYISSNQSNLFDGFNFYLANNGLLANATEFISIRALDDFYINVTYGNPIQIQLIFRCTGEDKPYSDCFEFICQFLGLGSDAYTVSSANFKIYQDLNGSVYEALVNENLDEINTKLDSVNNNLITIDSSIEDMNTDLGNKLTGVQNKIDAAADQAHQDAQDQVDAIEDLPQQQYDYEHQQDQNAANDYIEEFSGGGGTWDTEIDSYIDIEGLQESIGNLYGAFINNNKTYTIIFPGSGTVPILNKTLWNQQNINLQPFATSTPGRIMIIACNGVFSLVGIIGLVVFIRRVLQDILHH